MTEAFEQVSKDLTNVVEEIESEPKFALVRKLQKCGKKGCKCNLGYLHGPYLWKVTWDKETQTQSWKYLGKSPRER